MVLMRHLVVRLLDLVEGLRLLVLVLLLLRGEV